jgi:uncharacterized coiled-coil protein SlyX
MSLQQRLTDLAVRMATEDKKIRTLVNGNVQDLSALSFGNKSNLVASLNELKVLVDGAAAGGIDDSTVSTTKVWSSQKTSDAITSAINALVNGAGAAYDTLKELADLLVSEQSAIGTITAALAKRVAVDQAQTFTSAEQTQGRSNIGAQSAAAIGDPEHDFVADYNAALV